MKTLRFFLLFVLVLSLSWVTIVFAGPSLIRGFLISYTDGKLVPSNITISPNLDVNIGRLNFKIPSGQGVTNVKGFARSIKISWSLVGSNPLFTLESGPTFVEDFLVLDRIYFQTSPFKTFDFRNPNFSVELKNAEINEIGRAELLNASGWLSDGYTKIQDLNVEVRKGRLDGFWLANSLHGSTDEFFLNVPFGYQKSIFDVNALEIESVKSGVIISKAQVKVNPMQNKFKFESQLDEVKIPRLEINLARSEISGLYSLKGSVIEADVNIKDGSFRGGESKFSTISAKVSGSSTTSFKSKIDGIFEVASLYYQKNFIGTFDAAKVELDILIDTLPSRVNIVSKLNASKLDDSNVSAEAYLDVSLESFEVCFSTICEFSNLSFDYQINLDNENVVGEVACKEGPCSLKNVSHFLRTSNTDKIFDILRKTNMLNPLIIAYFYSFLGSADKVANGHELWLN